MSKKTVANKILLIDDSITQLEMMKYRLIKSGFDVVSAKDGYEGYKALFENPPDLILSDIVMPNLNGFQLCRLLKSSNETKEIPIILLTILDKKIDRFWANKSGANKFLSKTADFEEIKDKINLYIEKHPVSIEYKNKILSENKSIETIQHEINDILDSLLMRTTFLSEFRDLNQYLRHEKVLIEEIIKLLNSFVDYDIIGLFLNKPDNKEKNILTFDINKVCVSKFVLEKIKRDFFSKMFESENHNAKDFEYTIINNTEQADITVLNADDFETAFIYPFYSDNQLCGGICFYKKEKFDYTQCKFYSTMIEELLLLLKMRYIYSKTEYCSVTDGLTGLYNRRHFESNVEREFLRAKRYHTELSLAIIDIDFFKKINDAYGHPFGDYVLKEISHIVSSSFRKTDMTYRYGGEELVIILPQTSMENAFIPLERVREKVSEYDFFYNDIHLNVTISVGIGKYDSSIENQYILVEKTDEALYKAKQSGRNKVVMATYEKISNNNK